MREYVRALSASGSLSSLSPAALAQSLERSAGTCAAAVGTAGEVESAPSTAAGVESLKLRKAAARLMTLGKSRLLGPSKDVLVTEKL